MFALIRRVWATAVIIATVVGATIYSTAVPLPASVENTTYIVPPPPPVLSAGLYHTCAITFLGQVGCWGSNIDGLEEPIAPAGGGTYTSVATFSAHTCATTSHGTVECWGSNSHGQAPTEPKIPVDGSFTSVTAGYSHTCAVSTLGTVECWGSNSYGEAPKGPMFPESGGNFASVTAGYSHTCAVSTLGTVECWGRNGDGAAPTQPKGSASGSFASVAAGSLHTCATTSLGKIECWGSNSYGQAPTEPKAPTNGSFVVVAAGAAHTCATTSEGKIECWGNNDDGAAPSHPKFPANGDTFTGVAAGHSHTCATTSTGNVECWGRNSDGQAPSLAPMSVALVPPTTSPSTTTTPSPTHNASTSCVYHSCSDYISADHHAKDGLYTIDLKDVGTTQVYCDMSTSGGGWTLLAANRVGSDYEEGHVLTTGTVTNTSISKAIDDGRFKALKAGAVDILVKASVDDEARMWCLVASIDAMRKANCVSFDEVTTLENGTLAHDEDSGCTGTGEDYSMLWLPQNWGGTKRQAYASYASSLQLFTSYNYCDGTPSRWSTTGSRFAGLHTASFCTYFL